MQAERRFQILNIPAVSELLPVGTKVITAVSGGADSMALLDFLCYVREKRNLELQAAHLNHMLRPDANSDEQFVAEQCKARGVILHTKKQDVSSIAKQTKCGIEECGRQVRYAFFEELSCKFDAKTATAHTLSDNIETFLMSLTRGAGLTGLCGIPAARGNIIRPFLILSRQKIEEYCKVYSVDFITDSSNFSDLYTRNKIRLHVIPKLKQINPSLEKAFTRIITQINIDSTYLQQEAVKALQTASTENSLLCKEIIKLPKAIASRVIVMFLKDTFNLAAEDVHITSILSIIKKGSGSINIPGKIQLEVKGGVLQEYSFEAKISSNLELLFCDAMSFIQSPVYTNTLTVCQRKVIIETVNFTYLKSSSKNHDYIDIKKIPQTAVFRNKREGDLFSPYGRNCTKTLNKFLSEKKVPLNLREEIVVLADGRNILWVENFGISKLVNAEPLTKEAIYIKALNMKGI